MKCLNKEHLKWSLMHILLKVSFGNFYCTYCYTPKVPIWLSELCWHSLLTKPQVNMALFHHVKISKKDLCERPSIAHCFYKGSNSTQWHFHWTVLSYPLDVTAILFIVDRSGYNLFLQEDPSKVCLGFSSKMVLPVFPNATLLLSTESFRGSYWVVWKHME